MNAIFDWWRIWLSLFSGNLFFAMVALIVIFAFSGTIVYLWAHRD